jgi:hypothetical protein
MAAVAVVEHVASFVGTGVGVGGMGWAEEQETRHANNPTSQKNIHIANG